MGDDRRRLGSLFAAVVLAIGLACCAAAPPPPASPPSPPTPEPIPEMPKADVWDAPRDVLREAGYDVIEEDRAKGILVARRHQKTATAAEQRAGASELRRISHVEETRLLADGRHLVEMTITVQVKMGSGESSDLSVAAKAGIVVVARGGEPGAKALTRPIPSRGVLERELIAKIRDLLER